MTKNIKIMLVSGRCGKLTRERYKQFSGMMEFFYYILVGCGLHK